MNSYLADLENIIINAQSGGQSLSFALKPCATEKSVFDKEVNITPLWLIRKQEAERKAKEETERTRLQQEAERKAKELAEERIRRGTAEPVDLGLSVLWASHNIGARSSEQPGVYAAWTSKKEAINMWVEDWRLPTQQEMTELMQNCQWTWTVINGMPGFQIVAANGNNIFLPAGGSCVAQQYDSYGMAGRYWSDTSDAQYADRAMYLEFCQYTGNLYSIAKAMQMVIRPVKNR